MCSLYVSGRRTCLYLAVSEISYLPLLIVIVAVLTTFLALAAPPAEASTAVSVTITPATLTMNAGTTHPFQAMVSGSTRNGVTWSVTGGTISAKGLFTAPMVNTAVILKVTATSVADPKVSANSVVTVQPPLSIVTAPDTISVPSSGSYQFTAMIKNSTNTGVTWSCSIGRISTSGLYSAPQVTTETTTFVTATSSADRTKSSTSVITVTPIAALSITTMIVKNALVGTSYSEALGVIGGTVPYTWSIASGALPTGITLSSKGALSGSTQESGAFTFTVRVSDSSPQTMTAKQAFTLTVNLNLAGKSVPKTFFNMHINHLSTPWPSAPIAGQRFWGGSDWALVNTAQDVYDWTILDQRLSDAKLHHVDVLYDMGMTPVWAQCGLHTHSSCVQTAGCAGGNWGGGAGQCYWPDDLNLDGTGTNQHWKDWVIALAKHSVSNSNGHIKFYEIWNEPNITGYWRGTTAQLVRMGQDAACIIKGIGPGCTNTAIDPDAKVLTPSPALGGDAINNWLSDYLSAGGDQISDIIAFHGYNGTDAEKITALVAKLRDGALTASGMLNKPLFDDEFSWGTAVFVDPDEQSGFVARSMLLHWSSGVSRVYWYAWEDKTPLWSLDSVAGCTTPDPSGTGFTCYTGVAFSQVQSWLVGAALSQPCEVVGTIWTCVLTRSGAPGGLVVWDTAQVCSNGMCTTSSYKFAPISPNYTHYLDLTGKSHIISGTTVPIGYKPILLEN